MFKLITLKSGLNILAANIPGTEAVTTLVMCGAGSRYEEKSQNGISHFLEHMFFKGAKKYQTCKSVAETIDSIGGEFNAFTGKEYVGYYVTTTKEKYEIAFDVLSDMLLHSKFEQKEIEKERGVILEEINMYEDMPMQKVTEIFERQLFGDNPLGWEIAGTKDIVRSLNREDFLNYRKKQYTPNNMVVVVVGSIDEERILKDIEKYFKFESSEVAKDSYKFESFPNTSKIKLYTKPTEQAHIILGVPAPGSENQHTRSVLKLLAVLLGGNMSSRMFLEVREKQGLCYYIRTSFTGYIGAGYISTSAGVDLKRVPNAITAIKKEYKKITEKEVSEEELKKAKEFLKGKMILGLEDSASLAQFYAAQAIVYKNIKTITELKNEIDSITTGEIFKMAKNIFKNELLKLSVIGPFDNEKDFLNACS